MHELPVTTEMLVKLANLEIEEEWVLEGKFYVSSEHDRTDGTDICTEGCDWCMSD